MSSSWRSCSPTRTRRGNPLLTTAPRTLFPLLGSNYVSALLKPTFLKRDAPLALWFAGLPALSGGVWTLEAVKLRGGDPPACSCRFLTGRHGRGGGFVCTRRKGLGPSAFSIPFPPPTRQFFRYFSDHEFILATCALSCYNICIAHIIDVLFCRFPALNTEY